MDAIGSYELVGRVVDLGDRPVWKARDGAVGRDVLLKQLPMGNADVVEGLHSEAQLLAALSHPNIVSVYDLLESAGYLWLVEEWVDGATLSAMLVRAGRLSSQQSVGVIRGALKGLAYAHRNRIVHGDVCPANIVIDTAGASKLIDFELAVPTGAAVNTATPGYMSPEAARGLSLSSRSDVYSAAAVLAMLLRGRPLFEGPTAEAVFAAQQTTAPDLAGIDGHIAGVIGRALAIDPTERYHDAEDLLEAIEDAAERSYGDDWLASASVVDLVAATGRAPLMMATDSAPMPGASAPSGAPLAAPPIGPPVSAAPPMEPNPKLKSSAPTNTVPTRAPAMMPPAPAVAPRPRPRGGSHAAHARPEHVTFAGRTMTKQALIVAAVVIAALVAAIIVVIIALAG